MTYYKVVVLKCDIYETVIQDERHFSTASQANEFVEIINNLYSNVAAVVILMS